MFWAVDGDAVTDALPSPPWNPKNPKNLFGYPQDHGNSQHQHFTIEMIEDRQDRGSGCWGGGRILGRISGIRQRNVATKVDAVMIMIM